MKMFLKRFLVFLVFLNLSCEVEPLDDTLLSEIIANNNNNNNNNGLPSFKSTFNDVIFEATGFEAIVTSGNILISGFRTNGSNFSFLLGGGTTGTYPANDYNNFIYYQPAGTEFVYWGYHPSNQNANTGSVIITNIDTVNKTISGTFQFIGYWSDQDENLPSIEFTNGVFTNIPYSENVLLDDIFNANVNGVPFVTDIISTGSIGSGNQSFIFFTSLDEFGDSLTITVGASLGVGSYTITGSIFQDLVQIGYEKPSLNLQAFATEGSVTITQKSLSRIKGTFTGTINHSGVNYLISDGEFDLEY